MFKLSSDNLLINENDDDDEQAKVSVNSRLNCCVMALTIQFLLTC